ncbi:MAG TPA: hypothetical protein VI670_02505 [Thermoanaerobaculia bacterium]
MELFIEGYADEATRYMVKWSAKPLKPDVELGTVELTGRSDDETVIWYVNASFAGEAGKEASGEYSTPLFRPGMQLHVGVALSLQGGDVCHMTKTITVG